MRLASRGTARPTGRLLGRWVPASPLHWKVTQGPWLDNLVAELVLDGDDLRMWWSTGAVEGDDHDHPVLRRVAALRPRR